jgi:arylsulfatase A-like enzyme
MPDQWFPIAKRIGSALLFIAVFPSCVTPIEGKTRPNVILIVADDLGFSDIGVLGSEIPTPNIDALARGGMLFTNFHVAATCSPTRAMLLTGADSHRAGLGNMGEFLTDEQRGQPGYEGHLNHRVETLALRLRRLGYETAMAGKWHLGDGPKERPHARGFDRTLALMEGSGSAWNDGSPAPIIGEQTQFTRDGEIVERPAGFSATLYVNEMIRFIEEADRSDRGSPFFGYLAFQAVHWPHHAPELFLDQSRGLYDGGWKAVSQARFEKQRKLGLFNKTVIPSTLADSVPTWETMAAEIRQDESARMEAYAAMAMAMDYEIGRLVEFLRDSGRLDNTLILFVSDNGADPSEPERSPLAGSWYERKYPNTDPADFGRPGTFPSTGYAWARVSSTPLADHKGQPGEGGLRVPFIAHFPTRITPGEENRAFAYVTDIVPTVLDAIGPSNEKSVAGTFDGQSLWGVMRGTEAMASRDEPVGYELMGNAAIFDGDLKLVRRHRAPWRLFDIAIDPGETVNLSETRVGDFERLVAAYEDYEARMGVVPVPDDFDVMKQLLKSTEPAPAPPEG